MRKKYLEKNKGLDKSVGVLKNQNLELMEEYEKLKKEVKTVRKARSNNAKVLDKRMGGLQMQLGEKDEVIQRLQIELRDLNKRIKEAREGGKDIEFGSVPLGFEVKAKPTLFGDFEGDY